jgi:hypothetical protein
MVAKQWVLEGKSKILSCEILARVHSNVECSLRVNTTCEIFFDSVSLKLLCYGLCSRGKIVTIFKYIYLIHKISYIHIPKSKSTGLSI